MNKMRNFWYVSQISNFFSFCDIRYTKVRKLEKISKISSIWIEFMIATFGRSFWNFIKSQFRNVYISSYFLFRFFIFFSFRDISCQKTLRLGWVELGRFIVLNYYAGPKMTMKMYFDNIPPTFGGGKKKLGRLQEDGLYSGRTNTQNHPVPYSNKIHMCYDQEQILILKINFIIFFLSNNC